MLPPCSHEERRHVYSHLDQPFHIINSPRYGVIIRECVVCGDLQFMNWYISDIITASS
jgi:hypothetical protein